MILQELRNRRGLQSRQRWRGRPGRARTGLLFALLASAGVPSGSARGADPVSDPSPPQSPAAVQPPASAAPAEEAPPGTLKKLSLEELMNVEVTSVSRTESTVGQSPAAIFVITPDMIRRSSALTVPELFRMVPGMDVAQVNASTWAIGARGYSSAFGANFQNNLLVQVDGRSVYNPIFAGVFWDTVGYPLQDIDRIEVIRGPGGSVWGANAVDGVINIITKPAEQTQGGLISGGGGTAEQGFGELRYGGKLGNETYYRVYGQGLSRDDDFDSIGDPHDLWNVARGGFRIDSHPNDPNKLTLQGDYFNSDARSFNAAATPAPPHFSSEFSEISNGGNLLGRWTHEVNKDSSWSVQAYWDHVERGSFLNTFNLRWSTYDLDFQHDFLIGDNQKFNYGLGYRFNNSFIGPSPAATALLTPAPSVARESVFSGFVQDQITLAPDRLFLTLGTKLEYNTFTRFEYQPSGRLLWRPDTRQSVWAAVSRAVRTPDVLEHDATLLSNLGGAGPAVAAIVPNADIKSEAVIAYELGYRAQVTETVALDTAAFYNDYTKISILVPTSAAIVPDTFDNKMREKSYGVELGADWKPAGWWQLRAAYTFQELQLHADPSLAAALRSSDQLASAQTPQNQLYLQSSWDLPHHVELDLMGRYVERLGDFATPVPSYIALDARLGWKPREDLELAVVGQNLLDNHHPEFGGAGAVEIRRSVYGTITYRW